MSATETYKTFTKALALQQKEVISLVGGGGKTTLMFALASELVSAGKVVVTTTTTKILEPLPGQTEWLLISQDEAEMLERVRHEAAFTHITVAREKLASGKLIGVSPEFVDALARIERIDYVIVEADGAAHRSLKAPNATEPVIPVSTSLVIPVVGIDALNCPLTGENVFRPEIASALLGVPIGSTISAQSIAVLVTHPNGLAKGSPPGTRIVPFINKMDLCRDCSPALDIADRILAAGQRINRVVLGQASSPERAKTVVVRSG